MKETELKLYPCYCGGEMKIKKVAQDGGMDGTYYNWELTCKKCGLAMSCAADGFYGRKYKTFEEVVGDWNRNREKEKTITVDVLDRIRAEIEQLPTKTRTNWDGCCPDIDYPEIEYVDVTKNKLLNIIDKYRMESEE